MIKLLISQDEKRITEILKQILCQEGYVFSEELTEHQDIIKIIKKENKDIISLREKVIELGNSLYREKKGMLYKSILETIEKPLIEYILERTEGNQLKASKILGINRNTIRTKIKKLSINLEKWKNKDCMTLPLNTTLVE